jgi:RNA polymerase sigma-70 factor (ECF subfamily)
MTESEVEAWFVREVLPLESMLMQYLRHNWRDREGVEDLRQEIYMRVCEAAGRQAPLHTKAFVFTTARNVLITRGRREHVVPIETVADLDLLGIAADEPGPDRNVLARDELRRVRDAVEQLPPRYREVVLLRRVEGLPRREIAQRLGLAEATVAEYLAKAMAVLARLLYRDKGVE